MKKTNLLPTPCEGRTKFNAENLKISTTFSCPTPFLTNKKLYLYGFLAVITIFLITPNFALAGTGGEELKTVFDKTMAIAEGNGGKLAAAIAFVISLVAAVRGNLMAFGSALGVSILAGVGPSIFTSGVSAII